MPDLAPMLFRQKVEQVKAYFSAAENTHSPLHEAMKDTEIQTRAGQVLDGSNRGLYTYDRGEAKEWERYPKPIPASLRDTPARKLEKALSRMASQQNRVRDRASHSRKQQAARSHRPVRVWLHCQARFDHYPQRQCSLYGLNLQLDKWSLKQSPLPPLDCLMGGQSDQTCHHPHRFNDNKNEKWNGKPRLVCVNGLQPSSKTPVDLLPWTCWNEGK